ncbi:DUF4176 domain-containing protein [Niallia circulans]|uniref:DUF4176 domain-containing protein n=1 Tax=Niallia circulans TaxID=1397 RepID=UPI0026EAB904|nr:DUF4176 domain-containing protein [Niallia circulans]
MIYDVIRINSLAMDKGMKLPIGIIVLLDIISQPLIIYGRLYNKQKRKEKKRICQFVACSYPRGHISNETNVMSALNNFKSLESEEEEGMKGEK